MYMVILSSSARTTNYVPASRAYNKILLIYFFSCLYNQCKYISIYFS